MLFAVTAIMAPRDVCGGCASVGIAVRERFLRMGIICPYIHIYIHEYMGKLSPYINPCCLPVLLVGSAVPVHYLSQTVCYFMVEWMRHPDSSEILCTATTD